MYNAGEEPTDAYCRQMVRVVGGRDGFRQERIDIRKGYWMERTRLVKRDGKGGILILQIKGLEVACLLKRVSL